MLQSAASLLAIGIDSDDSLVSRHRCTFPTIYPWRRPAKEGYADESLVIAKSSRTSNELAVVTSNEERVRGRNKTVLTMTDVNGRKMIGVAWTMCYVASSSLGWRAGVVLQNPDELIVARELPASSVLNGESIAATP